MRRSAPRRGSPDVVAWDLGPGDVPAPLEGLDAPVVALLVGRGAGERSRGGGRAGSCCATRFPSGWPRPLKRSRAVCSCSTPVSRELPPPGAGPRLPGRSSRSRRAEPGAAALAEGLSNKAIAARPGHQRAHREVPRQRDPGEAGRDDAHGSAGARRAWGRPSVEAALPERAGAVRAVRAMRTPAAMALPCEARSKKP